MRLSVCIPTHERRQHLLATLDALYPQLRDSIEIVVADNASMDGTAAAVTEWIAARPHVAARLLVRDANVGFDRNLLDAVAAARGEYCWLLGDDDVPHPRAIESILATIKHYPGLPHLLLNCRRRDAISGQVDKPVMVAVKTDVAPSTASDFFFYRCPRSSYFRLLGTNVITMSANVVHRAWWNEAAAANTDAIGTSMIHVFVITTVLADYGPGRFLAAPQFDYTCNNSRPWPNDVWHDYRARVYRHLRNLGYDEARIASSETESMTHPTWRDFVRSCAAYLRVRPRVARSGQP